ncbi:MAG: hypothetical protein ABSD74_02935 [Rhizomicrobium sp.]|jgi:hypothetical protein
MNRFSFAVALVVAGACFAVPNATFSQSTSGHIVDGMGKGLVAGINAPQQSFTCTCQIGSNNGSYVFLTTPNTTYILPGGKGGGSFANLQVGQTVTVSYTGSGSGETATEVDLSSNKAKPKK